MRHYTIALLSASLAACSFQTEVLTPYAGPPAELGGKNDETPKPKPDARQRGGEGAGKRAKPACLDLSAPVLTLGEATALPHTSPMLASHGDGWIIAWQQGEPVSQINSLALAKDTRSDGTTHALVQATHGLALAQLDAGGVWWHDLDKRSLITQAFADDLTLKNKPESHKLDTDATPLVMPTADGAWVVWRDKAGQWQARAPDSGAAIAVGKPALHAGPGALAQSRDGRLWLAWSSAAEDGFDIFLIAIPKPGEAAPTARTVGHTTAPVSALAMQAAGARSLVMAWAVTGAMPSTLRFVPLDPNARLPKAITGPTGVGSVAMDARDDRLGLAWDEVNAVGVRRIYVALHQANGRALCPPDKLYADGDAVQTSPDLHLSPEGDAALVVWREGPRADDTRIKARMVRWTVAEPTPRAPAAVR